MLSCCNQRLRDVLWPLPVGGAAEQVAWSLGWRASTRNTRQVDQQAARGGAHKNQVTRNLSQGIADEEETRAVAINDIGEIEARWRRLGKLQLHVCDIGPVQVAERDDCAHYGQQGPVHFGSDAQRAHWCHLHC